MDVPYVVEAVHPRRHGSFGELAAGAGGAATPELLDEIAVRHAMDVVGPVPDSYL